MFLVPPVTLSFPSHPSPITRHTLAAGKSSPNRPGPSLAPASLDKSPLLHTSTFSKYTCYLRVPVGFPIPTPLKSHLGLDRPPARWRWHYCTCFQGFWLVKDGEKHINGSLVKYSYIQHTQAGRTMMPHEQSMHACMYVYLYVPLSPTLLIPTTPLLGASS